MKEEMRKIIRRGINIVLKSGNPDVTAWEEFFTLIITYLSFNRKIDLIKVKTVSIELSEKYNILMDSLNSDIGTTFDIIGLLKRWKKRANEVLEPVLNQIEEMKDVINGKGSKSDDEEIS